jgi:hypothetical protein
MSSLPWVSDRSQIQSLRKPPTLRCRSCPSPSVRTTSAASELTVVALLTISGSATWKKDLTGSRCQRPRRRTAQAPMCVSSRWHHQPSQDIYFQDISACLLIHAHIYFQLFSTNCSCQEKPRFWRVGAEGHRRDDPPKWPIEKEREELA